MNKESLKAFASLKGYGITSETDNALLLTKGEKTLLIDAAKNIITMTAGGKKGYNFVTVDTIDAVAKFLLK